MSDHLPTEVEDLASYFRDDSGEEEAVESRSHRRRGERLRLARAHYNVDKASDPAAQIAAAVLVIVQDTANCASAEKMGAHLGDCAHWIAPPLEEIRTDHAADDLLVAWHRRLRIVQRLAAEIGDAVALAVVIRGLSEEGIDRWEETLRLARLLSRHRPHG